MKFRIDDKNFDFDRRNENTDKIALDHSETIALQAEYARTKIRNILIKSHQSKNRKQSVEKQSRLSAIQSDDHLHVFLFRFANEINLFRK